MIILALFVINERKNVIFLIMDHAVLRHALTVILCSYHIGSKIYLKKYSVILVMLILSYLISISALDINVTGGMGKKSLITLIEFLLMFVCYLQRRSFFFTKLNTSCAAKHCIIRKNTDKKQRIKSSIEHYSNNNYCKNCK